MTMADQMTDKLSKFSMQLSGKEPNALFHKEDAGAALLETLEHSLFLGHWDLEIGHFSAILKNAI
jgi:hypothetical protein